MVRILVPAALDLGAECLALRNRCKVATTLGYGPRYLHATGQLHKGGPHTVVVLMFTADVPDDLPIPGEPLGFATLQRAQALGISRRLPPTVGGCCVFTWARTSTMGWSALSKTYDDHPTVPIRRLAAVPGGQAAASTVLPIRRGRTDLAQC